LLGDKVVVVSILVVTAEVTAEVDDAMVVVVEELQQQT
jgi:hypothetical protein